MLDWNPCMRAMLHHKLRHQALQTLHPQQHLYRSVAAKSPVGCAAERNASSCRAASSGRMRPCATSDRNAVSLGSGDVDDPL